MKDLFWLRKDVIAGSAGPDRIPWELRGLKDLNIGGVLSVNDGVNIRPDELAALSIDYQCTPLSANAPPQPGDLDHCLVALPEALGFVSAQMEVGKSTLVHCSSGKDRTCLLLCYYLCAIEGFGVKESIDEVKSIRSIALSAPGWASFAYETLETIVV